MRGFRVFWIAVVVALLAAACSDDSGEVQAPRIVVGGVTDGEHPVLSEIYFLALDRADLMLICDVSFDSTEVLTAALHSDVRQRLREDYLAFPPFTGRVGHYPMRRVRVMP